MLLIIPIHFSNIPTFNNAELIFSHTTTGTVTFASHIWLNMSNIKTNCTWKITKNAPQSPDHSWTCRENHHNTKTKQYRNTQIHIYKQENGWTICSTKNPPKQTHDSQNATRWPNLHQCVCSEWNPPLQRGSMVAAGLGGPVKSKNALAMAVSWECVKR